MRADEVAEQFAELEEAAAQDYWRELGRLDRWVLRRLVLKNPALKGYLRSRFKAEALGWIARQLRLSDRTPVRAVPAEPR